MTANPTDLPATSTLLPPYEPVALTVRPEKRELVHPRPLGTLMASAKRLTSRTVNKSGIGSKSKAWQDDAWEMFDLVGEERFLGTTLAGRLSQARFYVGLLSDEDTTDDPIPVEDETIKSILAAVGTGPEGLAQMVNRLGTNLFVAGDGWLVGVPRDRMPVSLMPASSIDVSAFSLPATRSALGIDIFDLEWRMLSVSEIRSVGGGLVALQLGEAEEETLTVDPDEVMLVRVWRPHPRRSWEADSPTRSSLSVLRELVGLTMHISAQVDSRLAGAGLLIVPQSAKRALLVAAGLDETSDEDPFTDALIEAMLTPIGDRASASALVPLVVTVPDEVTDKFNYLTFAKPLDTEARELRDEAIRRLALGQDAPPELLLGTGGMNHWGAWLVQEDVVTTHLEPPLALICDALTTQYLWPVLLDQGYSPEDARQFVIWYDVSGIVTRPNRGQDAKDLHAVGAIGDPALRYALGFDEADAPITDELDPAVGMALELVKSAPALIANPGLPQLVAQIRAVLTDNIPAEPSDPTAHGPVPPGLDQSQPPSGANDGVPNQTPPETQVPANPTEPAPPPARVAAANARVATMSLRARERMAERVLMEVGAP